MTVYLKEIGEYIAATNRVSRSFSNIVVEQVFAYIKEALATGQEVSIDKFGKFVSEHRDERMGRNPRDGTPLLIQERNVVKFKAAKSLQGEINQKETK